MRWHDWLGTGLVVCSVALCGCVQDQQAVTGYANSSTRLDDPDDHYSVNVARSQLPEVEGIGPKTTTNLQDAPPANIGELAIKGVPAARIRATVNNEAILDEEVKAACYPQLRKLDALREPERSQRQFEVFKETLDQIIEREVILQVAFERLKKNVGEPAVKKLKEAADKEFETQWLQPILKGNPQFKDEAAFKAAMREMNVSMEMMKRQWTRNFMAMEFMRQTVYKNTIDKIGHLQVVDYYNKHPEEFQVPDSVQWEDVFVSDALHAPRAAARQRAEAVLARMRKGEKVEQFLQEKLDDGDSSLRDGRGLGRKHGEIKPPDVEAPLFQLKDGEATIVELQTGFHVVRVVKRDYAGMLEFNDKTQKLIRDKLRNEIGQREMKKMVKELRSQAVIVYTKEAS